MRHYEITFIVHPDQSDQAKPLIEKYSSQVKKSNSIIILEDKILYKKPSNFSKPIAKLEKGRLLVLKKCENIWCNVKTDDYSGWVKTENIWGKN